MLKAGLRCCQGAGCEPDLDVEQALQRLSPGAQPQDLVAEVVGWGTVSMDGVQRWCATAEVGCRANREVGHP